MKLSSVEKVMVIIIVILLTLILYLGLFQSEGYSPKTCPRIALKCEKRMMYKLTNVGIEARVVDKMIRNKNKRRNWK